MFPVSPHVLARPIKLIGAQFTAQAQLKGCSLRLLDDKLQKSVCVCNSSYCDELVFEWPENSGDGSLVQSTRGGLRFAVHKLGNKQASTDANEQDAIKVNIDLGEEFQEIMGFGGAFTDAAGLNIQSLPEHLKHKLMDNYYGKNGSRYTFGRVVIAGADFSTRAYSYDDVPPGSSDLNLTHWSLAPEDYKYKIPLIKLAQEMVRRRNGTLKLYGSSWSPPAFMKTNKSLVRGRLLDSEQVYKSYAQYLVNFYRAYSENGIRFWGGTVQNEPATSNSFTYDFNSLQLSAEEAAKFVGKYLGPTLAANGYTKDNFKLMINDDNIDTLLDQVPKILADEEAKKYISGLAFHWYNSGRVPYDVLNECYDKVKEHVEFMLMTEACVDSNFERKAVDLGSWDRGEKYANDIIEDLQRHAAGWVDWNLALDEIGGPNWVSNFVDSPVIVSKDKTEFYKQPMFYVLAHFSRFFPPSSVRVGLSTSELGMDPKLSAVAVHKKDTGHVAVNILNKSEDDKLLSINLLGLSREVVVQAKSLTTVVLKL